MSRELMPKSGIMMPHVVVTRDAAVVGVSTVDGQAGAIDLTGKYLQKTDAAATYQTKAEGASKDYVLDSIQPLMSGALFRADPWVVNDTPFRSTGANGVESVDMMKVTTDNSIKIGSYASSVQGVEIHSAGRLQVVDQNDSGVETKYPVYSKRYRPEIEDLPFAAIGSYVKDSKGRTIGVTRTGINSDIKQLTQKVTFTQPVTVADAVGDYDAVTLRQLRNSGGGSGGPTMSGISNFGIGDFHLRDSRAFIPAFEVVSDGQLLNRADYPDLWAYAQLLSPIEDSLWLSNIYQRGRYSTGNGTTTFRVPDRNGIQEGSLRALYGRGDGGNSAANGQVFDSAAPNITYSSPHTMVTLASIPGQVATNGAIQSITSTDDVAPVGAGGKYISTNFDASRSSPIYGRSTEEILTRNFVGVWTIRAHGGFTAANTSWSVINSDAVLPNTGTSINGGSILSEYKVGTNVEGSASFKMAGVVGSAYSARITVSNKTSGDSKTFEFLSNGDLSVPRGLLTLEGNVEAKSQLISRGGRIVLVGNEDQSQSFIEFNSNNGYTVYGRLYSERDGDVTLSTSTSGTNQKYFQFLKDGSATSSGGWINSSDIRIKENVEPIKNPLDKMRNIKGVSWKLKNGGKVGFGFIAQDVEVDFPDAISVSGDMEMEDGSLVKDVKSVNTYGVAAALHHEAILELMKQIEELKKEIAELKSGK
ncbi:tail fibers protein [Escherichia phage vB_EcoP_EcoN5]|uniref:Tail fibers protein n=1 Tax=Escherichia phage vB_EcoP_EcoN5 TaxID=2686238 RepID=A0A7L4XTZ0_9CAUD|nr:tail fiber protein [Escherichia phage vB_EcoP_EcoN5]QGZ13716.1 tail fibers protein [Escherichia phage vB_EcoP_EcoN5]